MDIERARFNMIEQQIRPWEVLDPGVLALLSVVKREDFVPAKYRELAFADVEIPLKSGATRGQTMLAPRVEARMLQELGLKATDSVLEIGTGSGHMAALLAAKADVTEELDRLRAHVGAARALLAETGSVGRKFDFLMQEFMREANTLCSKSQSLALTRIGLDLKTVIDQMREQVQNVE